MNTQILYDGHRCEQTGPGPDEHEAEGGVAREPPKT